MAGGAESTSSAKRAKVDEAKDEEEVVCFRLPPELWQKIVDENLQQNDLLAFAMTCRFFRDTTKVLGKKMVTYLGGGDHLYPSRLLKLRKSGKMASHTLGWFQWVCDTWEVLPGYETFSFWSKKRVKGAVYEGDLVNYAALQGCVVLLRWLVEEKGCEPVGGRGGWDGQGCKGTGYWAGVGGSVEVLKYLEVKGYEFTSEACAGAARGGHLEALTFLRGLDPPCPWDWMTCSYAAGEGHLDVLKWARSQDRPCPWIRSQCRDYASWYGHQHVIDWIDQKEDESDVEYRELLRVS